MSGFLVYRPYVHDVTTGMRDSGYPIERPVGDLFTTWELCQEECDRLNAPTTDGYGRTRPGPEPDRVGWHFPKEVAVLDAEDVADREAARARAEVEKAKEKVRRQRAEAKKAREELRAAEAAAAAHRR